MQLETLEGFTVRDDPSRCSYPCTRSADFAGRLICCSNTTWHMHYSQSTVNTDYFSSIVDNMEVTLTAEEKISARYRSFPFVPSNEYVCHADVRRVLPLTRTTSPAFGLSFISSTSQAFCTFLAVWQTCLLGTYSALLPFHSTEYSA